MKCPRCAWTLVPHVDDALTWACTDCGYLIECDEMVSRSDRTTYYLGGRVVGVVMRPVGPLGRLGSSGYYKVIPRADDPPHSGSSAGDDA